MKLLITCTILSFFWSFSLTEDEASFQPWMIRKLVERPTAVRTMLRNHPQETPSDQKDDFQETKNSMYYNLFRYRPEESDRVKIQNELIEAYRMSNNHYKPLLDIFLRQQVSSKPELLGESAVVEEDRSEVIEDNKSEPIENVLPKQIEDTMPSWPIRSTGNQERKISLLGKRMWKKKGYFFRDGTWIIDPSKGTNHFDGNESSTSSKSSENNDDISPVVNDNSTSLTEKTQNPINESDTKSDSNATNSFPLPLTENIDSTDETNISAVDENATSTSSNTSETDALLSGLGIVRSSLVKGPLHFENEPIHESFMEKSPDFRPVSFFPSPEDGSRVITEELSSENKDQKESAIQHSAQNSARESAGPDLFPSSVFEERIRIPFYISDF